MKNKGIVFIIAAICIALLYFGATNLSLLQNSLQKVGLAEELHKDWNSLYSKPCGIYIKYPEDWEAILQEKNDPFLMCQITLDAPGKGGSIFISGNDKNHNDQYNDEKRYPTVRKIGRYSGRYNETSIDWYYAESYYLAINDIAYAISFETSNKNDKEIFYEIFDTLTLQESNIDKSYADNPYIPKEEDRPLYFDGQEMSKETYLLIKNNESKLDQYVTSTDTQKTFNVEAAKAAGFDPIVIEYKTAFIEYQNAFTQQILSPPSTDLKFMKVMDKYPILKQYILAENKYKTVN
ncbi:hypothetical protein IPM65_06535 [Candidatus Roizmanbacteria bacterium]|nr:MAG: hypothetical protein IPM65_06535 [Candidatus Roizmanbacteria bacterium]